MSKITLNSVQSLTNEQSALSTINNNLSIIQTAVDNTLSRDGTSPNTLLASLDLNSNHIINLPAPASPSEPLRLADVVSYAPTLIVQDATPGTSYQTNSLWIKSSTYELYQLSATPAWVDTGVNLKGATGATGASGNLTATGTPTTGHIATFASTTTVQDGGALATSATTDTTNASNISSGTLAAARGGAGTVSGILKANGSGTVSAATSGTDYQAADSALHSNLPVNSQSAAYTLVLSDANGMIFHPSTDSTARTFTIPANSSVAYANGTTLTFLNLSSGSVTIAITTDTMYLGGTGTTGSRTLAQYGLATAVKAASTTWVIQGSGLT